MILDMLVFIGFALVMLLLIAFFYFRDKSIFQKLSAYEGAIDDLNNRLYELEVKNIDNSDVQSNNFQKALTDVEDKFNDKLNEIGDPLLRVIRAAKNMEKNIFDLESSLNKRILKVEDSSKLSELSNSSAQTKEKKVIELLRSGISVEEIAKKERISQGEVEFILKISNLR